MPMPRIHAFEFNDAPWTPLALREHLIETLSRGFAWGRVLRGLVDPLQTFLLEAQATEVLDLAAGAGGPALTLVRAILHSGEQPPRFLLTDLLPHTGLWSKLRAELPQWIDFISEPVDAQAIPAAVSSGRARIMLNALHHFAPEQASRILADAVRQQSAVFIAEPFERGPGGVLPFFPIGAAALLLGPALAPSHKISKMALTWASPVAAVAGLWDSVISSMRVYSEEELRAIVAPFSRDYVWTYGQYQYAWGGRGYYFHGLYRP